MLQVSYVLLVCAINHVRCYITLDYFALYRDLPWVSALGLLPVPVSHQIGFVGFRELRETVKATKEPRHRDNNR